ncbi:MAG: HPr family phosphocarrier protein [PVC group bacterium]|nr:HPr family phosphocarrier protein [PVC group bacterium]
MNQPSKSVTKNVVIKNKTGLHARPAAVFVQVANKFDSEISVQKGKQKINGKSIMGVLMLAAGQGQEVIIVADGPDAEIAVKELEKILLSDDDEKKIR